MAAELGSAAVSGVASKAAESAFDSIGQHISYMFKYQSHLDDLKKKVQDLKNARERVEHQVGQAKQQGEEIEKDVEQWLNRVNEFTEGVVKPITGDEDKAKKRCFIGLCPNLIQRYMLGKKAVKAFPGGADLLGKGNFSRVSYRPPIQRTESVYNRGYEAFDSRRPVLQEIMEELKDANVNMVGVHGMAGVGKTTLVKKVAWQAKEDKLFDEVVMTTVTQTPDIKTIQGEIADQLGLTFHEESVSGRSHRLRDRLKREKRILVILDDIWAKLDLDAVGIPYGDVHRGIGQGKEDCKDRKDDERQYKILLTSRDQHVLSNHMNTQKSFLVDLLSDEEAWYLFRKIVGHSVETYDFRPIALEVVGKCARLPIAIETLAKALKGKSLPVWEDALGQLTRSNPRQIEGMVESVCSVIELSYNFLKSEGKSLFLLCALNNVGQNIYIADLLKYSMGLCLFRDVYTFEAGRSRLLTLIHNLKASSLLLDGITKDTVKMHDIIHAVAISIASSDEFKFSIKNVGDLKDVLEEKIPKTATAITLSYGDVGDELPQSLEYPKLKFFYLFNQNQSLQIPDLLFQGMKELQVLDLTGIRAMSLPSSLRCLKNLQTLCLDQCLLEDIAIVGELKKLKILSLVHSRIEKLPREIGQLTQLKMLDLSNCSNLIVIPPNVISSLTRLEELYMGNSFRHWEIEGVINSQEQKNASVLELKQLSYLTTLEIHVHDLQIIPQEFFSEKLKRYRILIGDVWDWSRYATYGETSRMLTIKLNNNISLIRRVKVLLKKTEELHLELNGIKNSIDELDEDGFAQLKHLRVQNGHELLYILNIVPSKYVFPKLESLFLHNLSKLKKICDGKLYAESFSKLRILKVEKCDMLEHLFSFSEHEKFSQLQEIEVIDCENLKQIFGEGSIDLVVENERNSKFEFTQLRSLVLQCLPQFIKFGMKVVFPTLENLKLSSIKIEDIWLDQQQPMSSSFQCLKNLIVEECNGLKFLFSSFMVKSFMQLQKLVICNCKSMEAVILDLEGLDVQDKIIDVSFPKLYYLKLVGLPKLTRFGTGNSIEFPTLIELHVESCSNLKTFFPNFSGVDIIDVNPLFDKKVAFHNLETLIVDRCKDMKSLFPVSIATGLLQLKELRIDFCGLDEIVANEEEVDVTPRFLFPQLTSLDLRYLPELKHFYLGRHTVECPKLKSLSVLHCEKINLFASKFSKVRNTDQESQPFLVLSEKVMPNLESMDLDVNAFKLQTKGPLQGFSKLKNLTLGELNDESIPFFYGFLKRLYNLESLTLWNYSLKELFPYEIDTWKEDSQMHPFLPNLRTLNVNFCQNLTHLLPSSTPFTNLTALDVQFCNGLINIFTCSIVKSLVQLTKITIAICKSLKEVLVGEFDQTEDEIVFCKLKTLYLCRLPSLTCFCLTTCAFKFPCLEQVFVIGCPKLKIFTQGSLSTPKLNRVQRSIKIENNGEYVWKGDLNSTIQQMFIEMSPEASSSDPGVST